MKLDILNPKKLGPNNVFNPDAIAPRNVTGTLDDPIERERIRKDPAYFLERYLEVKVWSKQLEIMESVRDNFLTAVRSANSVGKSFIIGQIMLHFLSSYEKATVLATAPTWRQVKDIVFKEARAAARKLLKHKDIIINQTEIRFSDLSAAYGLATNDPQRFLGYHDDNILVCVDEGSGVDREIYEVIDRILVSGNARLLVTGNPFSKTGRFYDLFKQRGDGLFKISSFDTPNFTANKIRNINDLLTTDTSECKIVAPHLTSPAAVLRQIEDYGPDSAFIYSSVLGEFPDQDIDSLIPMSAIEAAVDRFPAENIEPIYGVDPARFGDDKSAWIKRHGYCVVVAEDMPYKSDTYETAQRMAATLSGQHGRTYIDTIGVGGGVKDSLKRGLHVANVFGVNVGERKELSNPKKFYNLKAQLMWELRDLFLKGKISILSNVKGLERLKDQLKELKYTINKQNQIQAESKDDMKKRTGESPDLVDALLVSLAGTNVEKEPMEGRKLLTTYDRLRIGDDEADDREDSGLDFNI